jgi:hypothetical protein
MTRLGHQLRRVAQEFRAPADVWLFARLALSAAFFRVAKRHVPIAVLIQHTVPAKRRNDAARRDRIAQVGAWAARAIRGGTHANCLEQSLAIYRQLLRYGAEPRLALGFRRGETVLGHAWVMLDGEVLAHRAGPPSGYEIIWFDSKGRLERSNQDLPALRVGGR